MPDQFWSMTPRETELVLRGHYRRDRQMSLLVMAFINVHRDRKLTTAVTVDEVSVFPKEVPKHEPQTPEQMAAICKAIATVFGGRKKREKHG